MGILYNFRETKNFTKRIVDLITDEEFSIFQLLLLQDPEGGDVIPGGGIRKIRIPVRNKGKSSGARVVYYFAASQSVENLFA